ncbi:hypothetical protein N9948_01975 [bacterium]|nr:hypothetical protein [bacterium]
MTVPSERTRSAQKTERFLYDLLDPKKTPRVSKEVRARASACLRHFPRLTDLELSHDSLPDTWGKPTEDNE